MSRVSRDAVADTLRAAGAEFDESIVAAWLFGSVARGTARPDSDVDVAILRRTDRPAVRLTDLPLDVEDRLGRRLGRTVQVVDVARAPADLVHRVLRDGVLLFDRDSSRRIAFEVEARNRYFDMAPIWRQYRAGSRSA
jgi:predicted nucleotidyltransferase